jgi:ribosomal RNA-processing protein 1
VVSLHPPPTSPPTSSPSNPPLTPSWQDKSVPTSLATHIADIYLSELDAVLGEGLGPAPVVSLLAPHIALLVHTSQIVHKRLMNVLFTPLLDAYKGDDEGDDMGERPTKRRKASAEGSALSNIAANTAVNGKAVPQNVARSALLQALFKAAADEGAVETNRRKIYAIVRQEGDDDEE